MLNIQLLVVCQETVVHGARVRDVNLLRFVVGTCLVALVVVPAQVPVVVRTVTELLITLFDLLLVVFERALVLA